MRFSPTPEELWKMPYSRLRRLVLSTEETGGDMNPQQLAVIALRHTAHLMRPRLVIHKEPPRSLSLRIRGRWHHYPWEISRKDFKRLSTADKRRIESAGIPVVEEYHI
jgi:hypothetical protein